MFNKENKKTMAVDNSVAGSNRIVAGTKIKGEVNSGSDFRIDGEIEGTIQTSGRLVVGRTGLIKGNVVCTNADVEGTITGTLVVKNTLSLKATAVIEGEVQADKLAIEPGAVFNVTCKMGVKGAPVSNEPAKK
ncbi:polymer-forming cytoskeletal protein [uncultured Capnocytophaga sp.]|uniref:bactofilin family protein n=1 Tax=uncultured Capnocytophaga sp. TaxID=159273 RepID=UPI00261D3BD4|nr:polymer-forming cytoskeletal protein [uncultured Capnocytophaga sp.]